MTPASTAAGSALADRTVAVWAAELADAHDGLAAVLGADDRERGARLRRPDDRARHLLGAALVRLAVSKVVSCAPHEIALDRTCTFCGGPHGKPRLLWPAAPLDFSLSHAGRHVVLAMTAAPAVGVDIEVVRPDIEGAAAIVLTGHELARFSTLPSGQRPHAFLHYWTRKEALVKATGEGLGVPLSEIEVSNHDAPPRLIRWEGRPGLEDHATLFTLATQPGAVSHVAVLGARHERVEHHDARELLSTAHANAPGGSGHSPTCR